jgi:hypothetical protein
MEIVEERTIGPSLGAENIEKEILQDENAIENQDVQENNEPEVSVEDQLQEQKDKFIRLYKNVSDISSDKILYNLRQISDKNFLLGLK